MEENGKKLWRIEEIYDHWEEGGDGHYFIYPDFSEIGIVEATEEEIKTLFDTDWNKPVPVGDRGDLLRPFEFIEIKVNHTLSEIMTIINERKVDNRLCGYGTGN